MNKCCLNLMTKVSLVNINKETGLINKGWCLPPLPRFTLGCTELCWLFLGVEITQQSSQFSTICESLGIVHRMAGETTINVLCMMPPNPLIPWYLAIAEITLRWSSSMVCVFFWGTSVTCLIPISLHGSAPWYSMADCHESPGEARAIDGDTGTSTPEQHHKAFSNDGCWCLHWIKVWISHQWPSMTIHQV